MSNIVGQKITSYEKTRSRSDSTESIDSVDSVEEPRSRVWKRFGIVFLILTLFIVASNSKGCMDMAKHIRHGENRHYRHHSTDLYQSSDSIFEDLVEDYGSSNEKISVNLIEEYFYKRDDSGSDSTSTENTESAAPPVPFYNQASIRFLFVLGGFIVLNMFAIVVHHIYQKLSGLNKNYNTIDQDISPF